MDHPKTSAPTYAPTLLVVAVVLLILILLAVNATQPTVVEIASRHPVWTAQITGTTGDVAQVWLWTRTATLRTNLVIPAELRLDRRDLLLQVKSAGNQALGLDVAGNNKGSTHVAIAAGQTNSVEFFSRYPYPILPIGGFSTTMLPGIVPLGVIPVYDRPWADHPSRFEVATNLPVVR